VPVIRLTPPQIGSHTSGGHYTASGKLDGQWYFVDGLTSIQTAEPRIATHEICMVLYKEIDNILDPIL